MKRILALSFVLVTSAAAAYAGDTVYVPRVPEIDAVSGLAALGVVGAFATMMWERRRRG